MKKTKIYLDTTVINFIYADDAPPLRDVTLDFFNKFEKHQLFEIYISQVVLKEINDTKNIEKRQKLLEVVNKYKFEMLPDNPESRRLAKIYIEEKIIPPNKVADAEHIGISTVSEMDILLSWNFKHLANYSRKQKVKYVNLRENYFHPLDIISPLELKYERD